MLDSCVFGCCSLSFTVRKAAFCLVEYDFLRVRRLLLAVLTAPIDAKVALVCWIYPSFSW